MFVPIGWFYAAHERRTAPVHQVYVTSSPLFQAFTALFLTEGQAKRILP